MRGGVIVYLILSCLTLTTGYGSQLASLSAYERFAIEVARGDGFGKRRGRDRRGTGSAVGSARNLGKQCVARCVDTPVRE